jgi:putative FmdB family regulatory protein
MPTYDYRCAACGHNFEKVQRMSEQPGAECPECGSPAERRLSAGAGLVFKGSGFYITDYRSDSYKKAAKAESGGGEAKPAASSPAPASSSSPSGGESKPSAKSEKSE